ncbi:MAG: NAD-dependent epimerase [Vulcanimicrobiota bacterium]
MKILVTGCAGFIGFHLCLRLLHEGHQVVGVDSLNDYYSVQLKRDRLALVQQAGLEFRLLDIANRQSVAELFEYHRFDTVVNLAAQAGVRYSLVNPHAYVDSNLTGFLNILEGCRHCPVEHLVYASSSSVYGANTQMPFATHQPTNHPVSLYGATKKANEMMAHAYASMYGLPSTGLRFFTVYGPWGRPDMAMFIFARAISEGRPIDVFNDGRMRRDFTYVDDVVEGIVRLLSKPPLTDPGWDSLNPNPATSAAPYRIFNIGNNQPVELGYFIELIEKALGKKAERRLLPLQAGDVPATYADIDALQDLVGFRPRTSIEEGIDKTLTWFKEYQLGQNSGLVIEGG